MNQEGEVFVDFAQIPLGFTSDQDIFDSNGAKLLAGGCPLNATIRDQILARGVSAISLPRASASKLPNQRREFRNAPKEVRPLSDQRVDRSGEDLSDERADRFRERALVALQTLANIGEKMQVLTRSSVSELADLPTEITSMLLEDADQAIVTLSKSNDASGLASRCAQMSMLTINTAIELELDDEDVIKLGLAALLHDLSLYMMPEKFRDASAPLSHAEIWEYRRHPVLLDAFDGFSMISDEVRVIAGQVHERADGSGYPRGLKAHLHHPLSHVLQMVDSYLTLVCPGPGRPPVMPHDAVSWVLHDGLRSATDAKTTRAFISQMSLFPIGSEVELDNGETATVIRRDGPHYATPIVKVHGDNPSPLALSNSPIEILRPVSDPDKPQMRLSTDEIQKLSLCDFQH